MDKKSIAGIPFNFQQKLGFQSFQSPLGPVFATLDFLNEDFYISFVKI